MEDLYEKIFYTTIQFIKRVSREINYPIDRILETHLYDTNSVPASSPFEKLRLVLLLCDEGLLNLIWENIISRSLDDSIKELFGYVVQEKCLYHTWRWSNKDLSIIIFI